MEDSPFVTKAPKAFFPAEAGWDSAKVEVAAAAGAEGTEGCKTLSNH